MRGVLSIVYKHTNYFKIKLSSSDGQLSACVNVREKALWEKYEKFKSMFLKRKKSFLSESDLTL